MEYSSESELIDSLDYLTLPVKRSSSIGIGSGLCDNRRFHTQLLTDYRNKVSHKTQTKRSLHKCNNSLILNSTKEEIVEYRATVREQTPSSKFLEYLPSQVTPSQIKRKSLIKVIVTPHKTNKLTRRKQNHRHLHNTVSVEDRSIQTKHMCLVYTGRKSEKRHYSIKGTESATLLNDINRLKDDISLEQVRNVKQVLHSLNMDKKRKKGVHAKKRTGSPEASKVETKRTEKNIQANECQSVVRITGQIGLGDDNQIMVRCGVEGTKVPTFLNLNDYHHHNVNSVDPNASTLQHTVTQGTQMDGLMENAQRGGGPFFSKNVACFCNNENNFNEFDTGFNDCNKIKRCHSPLVVITVYPNDDRCENVKIFKQHTRCRPTPYDMFGSLTQMSYVPQNDETNQYTVDEEYVKETKTGSNKEPRKRSPKSSKNARGRKPEKNDTKASSPRGSRSRSTNSSSSRKVKLQSPKMTNKTNSQKNTSPNKNSPPNVKQQQQKEKRDNSPTRSKSPSHNIYLKRQEMESKTKSIKPKNEPSKMRRPDLSRSRSPSIHSNQNTKQQKGKENKKTKGIEPRQREFVRNEKKIVNTNMISTSTNTDHVLTKKALVDKFTKEIMGQMGPNSTKRSCRKPQLTESQVTISIDGENENYDVFLQQGRMTTDVRVKKTIKCPFMYQECENRDNRPDEISRSLINMIDVDDFRSGGYDYESPTRNDFEFEEIKVRDSLEIGHKRKDHHTKHIANDLEEHNFHHCFPDETRPTESFAPIKHYTGDKCLIPDPVKRDKEVRQLLGLEVPPRHECFPPCSCSSTTHRHQKYETDRPCQLYHANDTYLTRKTKETRKDGRARANQINCHKSIAKQTTGTQYEAPNVGLDYAFTKKMILNRNIQVFLQVEKFTEQKPIILSRKQYHKVKKAIEHTISKHPRHKLVKPRISVMATDVKKKEKVQKVERGRKEKLQNVEEKTVKSNPNLFANKQTAVLFTREVTKTKDFIINRYISSSNLHMSHAESSTKVAVGSSYSHSIHTIFRGFKKSRTPNLGTSVCSFLSNSTNGFQDSKSIKNVKTPRDKPRRPFLRRLMSCLILRASTASEVKPTAAPQRRDSYSESVDSYHISTSLGAIEMSSSIYDTSESFYSNHSIIPINNKIKRGFFGSMRGLLAYGRN